MSKLSAGRGAVFAVMWQLDKKYGYYVGFGIPLILNAFSFFIIGQVRAAPHC